jgi:hypothetical protein
MILPSMRGQKGARKRKILNIKVNFTEQVAGPDSNYTGDMTGETP